MNLGALQALFFKKLLKAPTISKHDVTFSRSTAVHVTEHNASNHSQYFNEIMPTIYRRFTEKESRQWRQIYKVSCFFYQKNIYIQLRIRL